VSAVDSMLHIATRPQPSSSSASSSQSASVKTNEEQDREQMEDTLFLLNLPS
jgi:hypothetical protein